MLINARTLRAAALLAAILVPTVGLAQGTTATAQSSDGTNVTGVGISGGIIAGAELSLLVESFIDVKPVWPWIVAPILTAGGGGVGGYYLEQASEGGSIALLVTSMALLVPTAIAVSVARAYEIDDAGGKVVDESKEGSYSFEASPTEKADAEPSTSTEVEARPDGIPAGAGAADGPTPAPESGGGLSARLERRSPTPLARHLASGSLFHFEREIGAGLGVPAFDVRPIVFDDQLQLHAPRTGLEVRVSLLKIELP
jgi:hypothetical protein